MHCVHPRLPVEESPSPKSFIPLHVATQSIHPCSQANDVEVTSTKEDPKTSPFEGDKVEETGNDSEIGAATAGR